MVDRIIRVHPVRLCPVDEQITCMYVIGETQMVKRTMLMIIKEMKLWTLAM